MTSDQDEGADTLAAMAVILGPLLLAVIVLGILECFGLIPH